MEQEQFKSPENAGHKMEDVMFSSKVRSGKIVTGVIEERELVFYLYASLGNGFKVKKIAGGGEEFSFRGEDLGVSKIKVEGKNFIAISIERPEKAKDHSVFWKNFESVSKGTLILVHATKAGQKLSSEDIRKIMNSENSKDFTPPINLP